MRSPVLEIIVTMLIVFCPIFASVGEAKDVTPTIKMGNTNCTITSRFDSGACGDASEIKRSDATTWGLLDGAGDPVITHFQPDPTDATKPLKRGFRQADGTIVQYARTKPFEISITDDFGNTCKVTIELTVICDKTKTGVNLIGKDWATPTKATQFFETDKLQWPNPPPPEKKSKQAVPAESVSNGREYLVFPGTVFRNGQSSVVTDSIPMSGSPVSIVGRVLADELALGKGPTVQLPEDVLGLLTKNGVYTFENDGLLTQSVIDEITIDTDRGPVTVRNFPVLINDSVFDLSVLGEDFLRQAEADWEAELNLYLFGPVIVQVPTLSAWAAAIMAVLLVVLGGVLLRPIRARRLARNGASRQ